MMQEVERGLRLAGTRIVDSAAEFVPGAVVLLVVLLGSLVAAVSVRYLLVRSLRGLDFDRRLEPLGFPIAEWTLSRSPAQLVGSLAFWTLMALGLLLGLTALDAALPSRFALAVLQYVPHLAAALVILIAGAVLARFLATAVLIGAVNAGLQQARLLSFAVKWLVLIVAAAMALDHIGIGRTVLLLAFGILFGGVILAAALAVGLGARDAVGRALERQLRAPAHADKLDHV
ncbi:MAG: hypothetical protein A3F70_02425 [Acidobacteria bacterium RIFCSPLOWO2_12_FULL_67_14]|nr:MAG: hypothetical protein A3H29_08370 [Acidobacteria bacterium RIFCSPLOWO2_02_FULL_67_21]OFW37037.1 MAG: hypothetical protein A3F70_02425 [Acidobacteria bacterium RIFCSPLOWO2_12_FULL_67_14]